ncbi:hypothetical protein B0J17DRAFT_721473 [Rhizoctonia solani]|nr:hypothetical protein B0J17DRAFT_721473 [Rhizoctonia solani]
MTDSVLLDLPRDTIDALLLPVPVLTLNGFFPFWTSKAYHGLTELRLSGKSLTGLISEPTVSAILKSSPHLRVLKFDLSMNTDFDFTVDNNPPELVPISPAPLKDLEVLIVGLVREDSLTRFLRLVAPGPKPLTLTPHCAVEPLHFSHSEIQKFFSRSNVVSLCTSRFSGLEQVSELLSLAPSPQVLALHHFSAEIGYDGEGEALETTFTLPDTNVRLILYTSWIVGNTTRVISRTSWTSLKRTMFRRLLLGVVI